eukprot:1099822-Rhodomonas_salina.1
MPSLPTTQPIAINASRPPRFFEGLTEVMLLRNVRSWPRQYRGAMCGTDMGYAATRARPRQATHRVRKDQLHASALQVPKPCLDPLFQVPRQRRAFEEAVAKMAEERIFHFLFKIELVDDFAEKSWRRSETRGGWALPSLAKI